MPLFSRLFDASRRSQARDQDRVTSWQRWPIGVLCLAGAILNAWIACTLFVPNAWRGRNDFLSFYTGAKLSGNPRLYDRAATAEVHTQAIGETGEIQFGRLPYYAWLLKPLARLPYGRAYLVWEFLSGAAFLGFVALWPGAQSRTRWLLSCWALPVFVCFFNGQEDLFLLWWVALAAWLLQKRMPVLAGFALTLCAAKFHLFTLIPLVVIAQRRWRMAAGMVAGAGVLLAISFAVAGPRWPIDYFAVLVHPGINTSLDHMPNLHSLFRMGPLGVALQMVTSAAIAVGVYLAARSTTSFEQPLALALAGGILVAYHGYVHDCSLLLPAILAFFAAAQERVRLLVFALASPIPWFLLQFRWPIPAVTQLLLLAFVGIGISSLLKKEPDRVELPELAQARV